MIRQKKAQKVEQKEGMPVLRVLPSQDRVGARQGSRPRAIPLIGFALILLFALVLHLLSRGQPGADENTAAVVTPEVLPVTQ